MAAVDGVLPDESETGMCDLESLSFLFGRECSLRQNQGIIMDTFFRELPRCLADICSEKEGTV